MIKVVIDTDPGTDDALALIMALNSPDLDIQGLTTVGGNASLAHTTRNTLRLMEYLGSPHMPVSRGAARPLRGKFQYAYHYHGPGGLTVRLPSAKAEPRPLRAPDYIISLAYSFPGELVLIALGPLTNVANAMNKEPRLKDWLKEIIVMGGAVEAPGNVTPHAEFNIYNDPAAANIVFSSGTPITLIGLDVCKQTYLTIDDVSLTSNQSKGEQLAFRIVTSWLESRPGRNQYMLCDPLTIAAAIQPELLSYREATISVETEDKERIGKTSAIYGVGNVKVASSVNVADANAAVKGLLGGKRL
ncbi:MAG: nucleoside hydrolase [Chloroflexi bacterium]|nr:nucleoside hydrolase [Chloroflexota bacterium]